MNCPHCGYSISENTKFCGNCGKPLPEELSRPPQKPADALKSTPVTPSQATPDKMTDPIAKIKEHIPTAVSGLSTAFKGKSSVKKYVAALAGLLIVFLFMFIYTEKSAKEEVTQTTGNIVSLANELNFSELSHYLTAESKENIVQVLSEPDYIGSDVSELISEGKDFAFILNDVLYFSKFKFLVKASSWLLKDSSWLSFYFNTAEIDVSHFGCQATVPFDFFSYHGELTFVKENGEWLVSLSKEDVRDILDSLKEAKNTIRDEIKEALTSK